MGGRRAGISKRRVKDHIFHTGTEAVNVPSGNIAALVQVKGCTRATAALVIVVERQRRVLLRKAGIGLGLLGEVARVAGPAVDMGVSLIDVVGIVSRTHAAHQFGAAIEHIPRRGRRGQCLRTPTVTGIDGRQGTAILEYTTHVSHVRGVEIAHVKTRHIAAATKHVSHVSNCCGVEVFHVRNGL